MKKELFEMFRSANDLSGEVILTRLTMAVIIACFIYISYRWSHDGSIYSKKFNVSLAALTVITTTVMSVIGNNMAMSLGMVGALSIVRYRSAVKDPMDLFFLFWGVATGVMCGARQYLLAVAVSLSLTVLLFILSHIPVLKAPYVLVINAVEGDLGAIKNSVKEYCKYFRVKSSYLSEGRLRMIVEIRTSRQDELLLHLGRMKGVAVSVLTYEGDNVG